MLIFRNRDFTASKKPEQNLSQSDKVGLNLSLLTFLIFFHSELSRTYQFLFQLSKHFKMLLIMGSKLYYFAFHDAITNVQGSKVGILKVGEIVGLLSF